MMESTNSDPDISQSDDHPPINQSINNPETTRPFEQSTVLTSGDRIIPQIETSQPINQSINQLPLVDSPVSSVQSEYSTTSQSLDPIDHNPPIDRADSFKQSINQSVKSKKESFNQSTCPCCQSPSSSNGSFHHSTNEMDRQSNNQMHSQPINQTINQSSERKSPPLNETISRQPSYGTFDQPDYHPFSRQSINQSINQFLSRLPPHILVDHSDIDTDTESEIDTPLNRDQSTNERSWFGASHYDQVDQSYKKDEESPINQSIDQERRKSFRRIKRRYGHVTYLIAPSGHSINQSINQSNDQPVKRAPYHARRRLSSPFRNKRMPLEIIAHHQANQSTNQPNNQSINDMTIAQTVRASNTRSTNPPVNPASFDELYNNEATLQPGQLAPPVINPSSNQSINQSINQSTGQPPSDPEKPPIVPDDLGPPTETDESAKLSQWPATALSANSISSSCLYAISFALSNGGIWAPLCFLFVVGVLYLFRFIYAECVTALPMNGGAYNVLLNTTSKKTAAVLGCLSLLSYLATAVVSAASGLSYLKFIWPGCNIDIGVVILIVMLAVLNLWGIQDSANLALVILIGHLTALFILFVTSVVHLGTTNDQEFTANMSDSSSIQPNIGLALLQGFGAAMLGISGFETSANFVEEQKTGVFSQTLRNMWMLVSVINPTFCLLTLCVVPLHVAVSHQYRDVLMAYFAHSVGGEWCTYLICIDAFVVLSASVLTSYVGVTGLARRLTLDRGLPQILLKTNPYRGTNHWIICSFCVLSIVLYFIVSGDVTSLSNVYTLSFLLVMTGFAVGNMLLKVNRPSLRREVTASWRAVVSGLCFVLLAFSATIARDPSVLAVWGIFFAVALSIVALMFFRVKVLKAAYFVLSEVIAYCKISNSALLTYMERLVDQMNNDQAVFFSKHGSLESMNQAVLYVLENEEATRIRIVHVYENEWDIPPKIARNVAILDTEYPDVQVSLVLVKGTFSVETVDFIAHELKVEKNMMFLTAPRQDFRIKLETLGGVRLIIK